MSNVLSDREIVKKDIESLYLGNLKTVEFDIKLPTKGKLGSIISWHSKDDRWIDCTGRVHRPEYGKGDRVVPITATFSFGEVSMDKIYEVNILEEENKIQLEKVFPIVLDKKVNEEFYLPSAVAIQTKYGDIISHSITWNEEEKKRYDEIGEKTVYGRLTDTAHEIKATINIKRNVDIHQEKSTNVNSIAPSKVQLKGNTLFKKAQDRRLAFLLSVNDDQMLYNFRKASGLDTKGAPEMIGWDSRDSLLRGHTTGHYLSALALCYAATDNKTIFEKLTYMISELNKVQLAFEADENYQYGFLSGYSEEQFDLLEKYTRYPEIWAPYYTLHKIFAGLLDSYNIAKIDLALTIADKLGDWVYNRLSVLPNKQLKKMWGMYIAGELGGMNESLAELYIYTKKEKHIKAAKLFDNDRLFFPLEQKVDALGALHANQHIPQVVGAMRIFDAIKEKKYYEISRFFWESVVNAHIYSIGGTGEGEMFKQPYQIGANISDNTAETCASYNMLKLTKNLYEYENEVRFMDYYERTMFNHILSSTDHECQGASTYFMPTRPGSQKGYDDENSCCHGTGLENHFKYTEALYFIDEESLYVNLFVSSEIDDEENGIQIEQKVHDPFSGSLELHIKKLAKNSLKIRLPYWHKGAVKVLVNQSDYNVKELTGYLIIEKQWKKGDKVSIQFSPTLRLEPTPDKKNIVSLAYGPYILAAISNQENYLELPINEENLHEEFIRIRDTDHFMYEAQQIEFVPLAEVNHEHYHIYINTK
jgi:DUF1680 family protein